MLGQENMKPNTFLHKFQDGVFDGLIHLTKLDLQENQISAIGLHVFLNSSDLRNLKHIDLAKNRLTEIETWPFIRTLLV